MMTRQELRQLFLRERARFARPFPWVAHVHLVLVESRCIEPGRCAFRDLAYADTDTGKLAMLARALSLPRANIVGLLRHELGHMADLSVGKRGSEQRADDIAEMISGEKIRYDKTMVQTVSTGTWPRPWKLHR